MTNKTSASSFWQDNLNSIHPSLRIRYLPYMGMAETMDNSFDAALGLWRSANAAALQAFRSLLR